MTTTPTGHPEEDLQLQLALEVAPAERRGPRSLAGYLFMPALLAATLLALYLWLRGQDLSSTARQRVLPGFILTRVWEHLVLTGISTVLVLVVAIPLGVLLTRSFARRVTPVLITFFNLGQAVPTIGLLAILALTWDIGFWPAVVGLVAYCALSVVRNTMVGLTQVDASVIEAARGMGMTRRGVLMRIELPLAVPVMMAGVRTALVINVGTATIGTFINAGGLGDVINTGIARSDELITVTGSVLTAVLALLVDYVAGIAEDVFRPKGL